jgi:hypothetical protein
VRKADGFPVSLLPLLKKKLFALPGEPEANGEQAW